MNFEYIFKKEANKMCTYMPQIDGKFKEYESSDNKFAWIIYLVFQYSLSMVQITGETLKIMWTTLP